MTPPCTNIIATWALSATTWNVLWAALGVITILIVVLLQTRWVREKTWRKCAILSLWVHVLLALAATTVRIVVGAPESGSGEPIRVAVMPVCMESKEATQKPEVTPAWEQIAAPPLVPPLPDPAEVFATQEIEHDEPFESIDEPSPAPPAEAPDETKEPPTDLPSDAVPESPTTPVETPQSPAPTDPHIPVQQSSSTESANEVAESGPPEDSPSPAPDDRQFEEGDQTPGPVLPPAMPTKYADRFIENREALASKRGGSSQTEKAVQAALGWLADAQSKHGGWEATKFGAGKELFVLGHDRQGAGANADTGVTGLALLAFLGAGHTHYHGEYRTEVARGLEYLRQRQRSDGALYGDARLFARTYCHSMATFALCEALAMTRDERLRPIAERAVAYTLAMQHPSDGGWRYLRGHTGDTSQLGWVMMALASAQWADIDVPHSTWTGVERFLRRVQRGNAGGLAAYRPDGPASRTMTAEAWYCQQLLANTLDTTLNQDFIREATESLSKEMPTQERPNLYYWYYATLALHYNRDDSKQAADAWQSWNHALTAQLLASQLNDGSWSDETVWGGYGGRVYTTALSAMCLEVYYRYTTAPSEEALAERAASQSRQR